MKRMLSLLRRFPMVVAMTIFILVVSLIPIPETPLSSITLIDKWTHIGLYTILGMVVAHEYFHNQKSVTPKGMFLGVWLLPSLLGGAIELLQAYCTNGNRSGEWLDFIADIIGSTIALAIGTLLVRFLSRH